MLEDTDGDGDADDTVVREDNVDIEVVEPDITTDKSVTSVPGDPDAADIVGYSVVIENASAVDAFDVTFLDVLPAEMRTSGSLTATRLSDSADVSAFFAINPAGTQITHSGSGFDLVGNDRITLTYNARITEAVLDGQILTNEVDTEWTSTPGVNSDERGGDDDPNNPADPTDPDDYESDDSAFVEANLLGYDFDKSIFATSESHTDETGGVDNTIEDLVVGETVTYALTATFAEGTTLGVLIEDDISIAEGLLDVESVTVVGGANMSSSAGAFATIPVTIDDRDGDGHNEYVIVDLGSVINNASDGVNAAADRITVYVTARVVNVIENQEGDVVRNDAVFTFLEDENGDNVVDSNDTPTEITDSENVEILEPTLTIEKSVNNETPSLTRFSPIHLRSVISLVPVLPTPFDLVIDDVLSTGLTLVPGSVTLNVLGSPTNPSSIISNTSSASNIEFGIDRARRRGINRDHLPRDGDRKSGLLPECSSQRRRSDLDIYSGRHS